MSSRNYFSDSNVWIDYDTYRVRNEQIYERFGMSDKELGVICGEVRVGERIYCMLKWYGHVTQHARSQNGLDCA